MKPRDIEDQILYTCRDLKPNALKIGMLQSEKVIISVLKTLKKIKTKKIILDPVMVSKGGAKLINDTAIHCLKKRLIKKVYIITPNIPEAEVLTNIKIKNKDDMFKAGNILLQMGAQNVLLKGGHKRSKYV